MASGTDLWFALAVLCGALSLLAVCIGAAAILVLQVMHASVGCAKPTQKQLEEEDPANHALFRHVPGLQSQLAWRQLGTFPTPVHMGSCMARNLNTDSVGADGAKRVHFWVKREDMCSTAYGGNKVRTLQHQLGVIEAKVDRTAGGLERNIVVFGSGGSNQVVATLVHVMLLRLRVGVSALWIKDPPDLDNTLNMLSALSLQLKSHASWGSPLALARAFSNAVLGGHSFVLPLGGNSPSGVLGQASGALELAEQIEAGDAPDCDGIYVAVGSSCTISGLIIGIALARKLGLKAFSRPGFALRLVLIHDVLSLLHRVSGLYKSAFSRYVPLTPRHSIHAACGLLSRLGGPDVLAEALAILQDEAFIVDDARLIGKYGAHSRPSLAAARLFDDTCSMSSPSGEEVPGLVLCGHFTAKAMAAMCHDLRCREHAGKTMILWQTKSLVQPRGAVDEWEQMQGMPEAVREWAQHGRAHCDKRPGKVDLKAGTCQGYRALMTQIAGACSPTGAEGGERGGGCKG